MATIPQRMLCPPMRPLLLRRAPTSSAAAATIRRPPPPPPNNHPQHLLYYHRSRTQKTPPLAAPFHTAPRRPRRAEAPRTDFAAFDVLGNTPVPATSVDVCMSNGFQLNSGSRVLGGSGVLLVGGEAFVWRPWVVEEEDDNEKKKKTTTTAAATGGKKRLLLNGKGQWGVPEEAFGLLGLVWPRPDLLILGVGPEIRPITPELRRYISSLGIRLEVLDTRNAAAQFNLLATERGVNDVAAALIPIGWKEGVGASW